jgi:hypothetical protein
MAASVALTAICAVLALIAFRYAERKYSDSNNRVPAKLSISEVVDEVTVSQWRLSGPFKLVEGNPATDPDGFTRDYLAALGHPETTLTEESITALCKKHNICRTYSGQGAVIPLFRFFPYNAKSVVYATASIMCDHDIDLVLEAGYNQGVFVWVNGQLTVSVPVGDKGDTASKYHHLSMIHLKRGNNLLTIKTDSGDNSRTWSLIASLMSIKSAREKYIEKADGYLLANRFLKPGEHLAIQIPELSNTLPAHIVIADWKGATVFSKDFNGGQTLSIDTSHLPNGYYTVTMQVDHGVMHDELFLGDTNSVYRTLCREQLRTKQTDPEYMQRDPLIQRYRILTSQQYYHPTDQDWQRKLLLVMKNAILEQHYSRNASWTQLPGMHLRGYVSQIDGTTQYYLIYVPEKASGPLPLVIDMPYYQQTERPFLESALAIGWPQALDDIKRAADRCNE